MSGKMRKTSEVIESLDKLKSRIDELSSQIDELKSQVLKADMSNTNSNELREKMRLKMLGYKQEIDKLKREKLEDSQKAEDELKRLSSESQIENGELLREIKLKIVEVDGLNAKMKEMQSEIKKLKDEKQEDVKTMEETRRQISEACEKNRQMIYASESEKICCAEKLAETNQKHVNDLKVYHLEALRSTELLNCLSSTSSKMIEEMKSQFDRHTRNLYQAMEDTTREKLVTDQALEIHKKKRNQDLIETTSNGKSSNTENVDAKEKVPSSPAMFSSMYARKRKTQCLKSFGIASTSRPG